MHASAAFCKALLPDDPRWAADDAGAASPTTSRPNAVSVTLSRRPSLTLNGSLHGSSLALNDSSLSLHAPDPPRRPSQHQLKMKRGSISSPPEVSLISVAGSGPPESASPQARTPEHSSFSGGRSGGAGLPFASPATSAPRRKSSDGAPSAPPSRRPSLLPTPPKFAAEAAGALTLPGVGLAETYHLRELEPAPGLALEIQVAK